MPIALTCKNYLTALKQREAHDLHRIAQVLSLADCTLSRNEAQQIPGLAN